MILNRENGLCHPNNRTLLQLQHDELVEDNWWMPDKPGGLGNMAKGVAVCNTPCPIRESCGKASGGFGVWGGIIYGLSGRSQDKADRLGLVWRLERDAPARPENLNVFQGEVRE